MELKETIDIERLNIGETKREIERVKLDHQVEDGYKEELDAHLRNLIKSLRAEYEPDIERPNFRLQRFREQMTPFADSYTSQRRRR